MPPDIEEVPWWYNRCMHNTHSLNSCWFVHREAEGVVILCQVCLPRWHITVSLHGKGSTCREFTEAQFLGMSQQDIMAYIQSQRQELRQL